MSDSRVRDAIEKTVPAGLLDLCVQVRIAAADCRPHTLEELVRWACAHSPVGGSDLGNAKVIVDVQA